MQIFAASFGMQVLHGKTVHQLTAAQGNDMIKPSNMIGKQKGHQNQYGAKSCGGNVRRR